MLSDLAVWVFAIACGVIFGGVFVGLLRLSVMRLSNMGVFSWLALSVLRVGLLAAGFVGVMQMAGMTGVLLALLSFVLARHALTKRYSQRWPAV